MATSALIVNANTVTLEGNTLAVNVTRTGNNIRNNDSFLIVDAVQPILYNAKLSILNDSALPMITFSDWRTRQKFKLIARDNTSGRCGPQCLASLRSRQGKHGNRRYGCRPEDLDFSQSPHARQWNPSTTDWCRRVSDRGPIQ